MYMIGVWKIAGSFLDMNKQDYKIDIYTA